MPRNTYFDDRIKVYRPFSRILKYDNYLDGEVVTPNGIVSVYTQGGEGSRAHTRLDFVREGQLHMRTFQKRYSARGLVTLANRYAEELSD